MSASQSAEFAPSHARIQVVVTPPLAPDELPPLTKNHLTEDFVMEAADLDPESCPPDLRLPASDGREAWVYDHGDVADLVFVRL